MSFLGGCWKKAVGVFARMRVWPPDGQDARRPSGEHPDGRDAHRPSGGDSRVWIVTSCQERVGDATIRTR